MLSDTQIESLETLLQQELSYFPLREELLDHICCAIEAEIETGHEFARAKQLVLDRFGEKGLLGVQQSTIQLLTHNTRRMKQLMYLGSIAAAISLLFMLTAFSQELPSLIPMEGKVSSEFGKKASRFHHGIDIKADEGTPVYAAADGIVEFANERGNYGLLVELNHSPSYTTRYAHLSKVAVKPGTKVKQGQLIAYCGNTGKSTGPHLHFEVRKDGKPINPREVWKQ